MSCPHCAHCTDMTSPEAVKVGRQTPVFPVSLTVKLLEVYAPTGALDRILRWVEGLRGKRGASTQLMTFVAHDDEWTKLLVHLPPEVVGGARRGNGLDIGEAQAHRTR